MKDQLQLTLIKQLGPSILHVKIPQITIDVLNDYIDKIVKDKKKIKELNAGNKLVGDVTQEFMLESTFIIESGWYAFLKSCVDKWIEVETKKKIKKFKVKNSWIVRQFKNEYNPTHWHGGHISGVGFLKVPATLGGHLQDKENSHDYRGGYLELIHGARMFLCKSTLDLKPQVGDFYFFPHYLMHAVFPFKGTDDERRSISFNATIDEEIYNVYGS